MKTKKVTISDIASSLGISPVTISRALSGQPGVGDKLKTQILQKAKDMGYIKRREADPFHILVLHQKPYIQDNSNFSAMMQGIILALQNAGEDYSMEFIGHEAQEKGILPSKLSLGFDFNGAILIGRFSNEYIHLINDKISNLIIFSAHSPDNHYDSVCFNLNNAGYRQCEYLIRRGHQKIGFVGSTMKKNRQKLLGITSALEDYKIEIDQRLFIGIGNSFQDQLLVRIDENVLPTAFICDSDYTALEVMKFLYGKKIRVPDDISIIGSGNSEISLLSIPSLTTLDFNIPYCCETVVSTLLKRMNLSDKPYEHIEILSNLIERDSIRSQ